MAGFLMATAALGLVLAEEPSPSPAVAPDPAAATAAADGPAAGTPERRTPPISAEVVRFDLAADPKTMTVLMGKRGGPREEKTLTIVEGVTKIGGHGYTGDLADVEPGRGVHLGIKDGVLTGIEVKKKKAPGRPAADPAASGGAGEGAGGERRNQAGAATGEPGATPSPQEAGQE
jgi:hypothetical protein